MERERHAWAGVARLPCYIRFAARHSSCPSTLYSLPSTSIVVIIQRTLVLLQFLKVTLEILLNLRKFFFGKQMGVQFVPRIKLSLIIIEKSKFYGQPNVVCNVKWIWICNKISKMIGLLVHFCHLGNLSMKL